MGRIKTFSKFLLFFSILSLFLHLYISLFANEYCFWNEGIILGLGDFIDSGTLVLLMGFILIFTVYILSNSYKGYWEFLVILIVSSVGNIFDRFFHGGVCDYIKIKLFIDFPIFNLNDIFISTSLLFILIIILHESAYCKKNGE